MAKKQLTPEEKRRQALLALPKQLPPVDSLPKYTHTPLRSQKAYFDFFDAIVPNNDRMPKNGGAYDTLYRSQVDETASAVRTRDEWRFGKPLPNTLQEVLDRTTFQDMVEYQRIYNDVIKPMVQNIIQDSKASLDLPTLKYNDRGLGSFDFAKASMGLVAVDKYFSLHEEDFVPKNEVKTYKEGGKFKYKLISDNTPVVIVPEVKDFKKLKDVAIKAYKEIYEGANIFKTLKKYNLRVGGKGSITSTIKKSYIAKEIFPKPKNAIRLFVKIGANSGIEYDEYKWTGFTAIGIADLLTSLGYSVCIIGIWGLSMSGNGYNDKGVMKAGMRSFSFIIKGFGETLDTPSLLYTFSDLSFFRGKVFLHYIKSAFFYKDYISGSLGSTAYMDDSSSHGISLKQIILQEYGKKDSLYNGTGVLGQSSQFLYYMIGDINSEAEMATKLLDIGLNVVNENAEAREKIFTQVQP